jgi:hypothetical protein
MFLIGRFLAQKSHCGSKKDGYRNWTWLDAEIAAVFSVFNLQVQVTNFPIVSLINDGKLPGLDHVPSEKILVQTDFPVNLFRDRNHVLNGRFYHNYWVYQVSKDQYYTYIAQIHLILTILRHFSWFSSAISNVLIRQQNENKQRGRNREKLCTLFESQGVNDSKILIFWKPLPFFENKTRFLASEEFEENTSYQLTKLRAKTIGER